jgi:hypothetical protein
LILVVLKKPPLLLIKISFFLPWVKISPKKIL